MPRIAFLWRRVCALGIAQIVSWGTLFYTIAVLGAAMRADTGVSDLWLFGSFTAGLFLSGVVSPFVGRQIDAFGGRRVLAAGSLLGAAACAVLAAAQGPLSLAAGWLLAGVAMAACLYDPAFATLHQIAGLSYRRAVTALTLFGGFASTVFWPLSQYLLDTVGWRQTFAIYAALHLALCLPLHVANAGSYRHAAIAAPASSQPAASVSGPCAVASTAHASAPVSEPAASTRRPPNASICRPTSGDTSPDRNRPAVKLPKSHRSVVPVSARIAPPSTAIV